MRTFYFLCALLLLAGGAGAQDFITRGKIEFEVKRNNWRKLSDEGQTDPDRSGMPQFEVHYCDLLFAWNQSIYREGRKAPSAAGGTAEVCIFVDLDKRRSMVQLPSPGEETVVMSDSLRTIKWRIENETRKIAGWECRKAVGRIFDSVYVVAFYCPEIVPQSGPELFNGLPGMILGLAIPRQHTTWFATKIELAGIDESNVAPPVPKKGKQFNKKELADFMYPKIKSQMPPEMTEAGTKQMLMDALGSYQFITR